MVRHPVGLFVTFCQFGECSFGCNDEASKTEKRNRLKDKAKKHKGSAGVVQANKLTQSPTDSISSRGISSQGISSQGMSSQGTSSQSMSSQSTSSQSPMVQNPTVTPIQPQQKMKGIQPQKKTNGRVLWIRPPAKGISRIDNDGSFVVKANEECTAGFGCIIRQLETVQKVETVQNVETVPKIQVEVAVAGGATPYLSLASELEGIYWGFRKAEDLGLQNVVLGTDCLPALHHVDNGLVVHKLIGRYLRVSNKLKKLINRIIECQSYFVHCELIHLYRGANEVANLLAHIHTNPTSLTVYGQGYFDQADNKLDEVELKIKGFIKSDAAGKLYLPHGEP